MVRVSDLTEPDPCHSYGHPFHCRRSRPQRRSKSSGLSTVGVTLEDSAEDASGAPVAAEEAFWAGPLTRSYREERRVWLQPEIPGLDGEAVE